MKKKNSDVRFVRIRGRIVPIRTNRQRKPRRSGNTEIAAGIALGAASGAIAGSAAKFAVREGRLAKIFLKKAVRANSRVISKISSRKTAIAKSRAIKGFAVAKHTNNFGGLAAGLLVGQGLSNKFEADTPGQEFIANFAGAAGGFVASAAFNKVLRGNKAAKAIKQFKKKK